MIYVCTDLHGQYTLFMKMLKAINFSGEDTLYIMGDIIDRGPKSIRLLKYIMSQENMICLIGNHEHFMWAYENRLYRDYGNAWLSEGNGGIKTKKQFDRLPKKEKEEIMKYIEDMYLQVELELNGKTYLLSHSAFMYHAKTVKWFEVNSYEVQKVVWNSPWRFWEHTPFEYYEGDERIHIIGHVPVQKVFLDKIYAEVKDEDLAFKKANKIEPVIEHNIINIDGGCAYRSRKLFTKAGLICMNLTEYANEKEDVFTYFYK